MEKSNLVFIITCSIFLVSVGVLFVSLYRTSKKLADDGQGMIRSANDFFDRAQKTLDKADKVFDDVSGATGKAASIFSGDNLRRAGDVLKSLRN